MRRAELDLTRRLAHLERQSSSRRKPWHELVRDWAGLASLVLALAYSFPLGLWDRFVVSQQQSERQQLAELRNVLEQSIALTIDTAKALSGISDPFLYDTVTRAANTRLHVLMLKQEKAFALRQDAFTVPELIVLGFNFSSINKIDTALQFFKVARQKSQNEGTSLVVETMRWEAKALFMPSPSQDLSVARSIFTEIESTLSTKTAYLEQGLLATIKAEWGLLELIGGDWLCGQLKTEEALSIINKLIPVGNDGGNFLRLVRMKAEQQVKKVDQPEKGCS